MMHSVDILLLHADVITELENLNSRLSCIRSVVHGLPQANFDLLKRVAEHLDR